MAQPNTTHLFVATSELVVLHFCRFDIYRNALIEYEKQLCASGFDSKRHRLLCSPMLYVLIVIGQVRRNCALPDASVQSLDLSKTGASITAGHALLLDHDHHALYYCLDRRHDFHLFHLYVESPLVVR